MKPFLLCRGRACPARHHHPSPVPGRGKQRPYWVIAFALCVGNLFVHKPLSDLCDWVAAYLGRTTYERVAVLGIGAFSAVIAIAVLRGMGRSFWPAAKITALLLLGLLTFTSQRWLLVTNIELIHFPQYAILGALLLATGLSAEKAWLVTTGAGVVDEIYQYLVIHSEVPGIYLDYNDMLLNTTGAAWAVILLSGSSVRRDSLSAVTTAVGNNPAQTKTRSTWIAAGLLVAVIALLWLDPPVLSPVLQQAPTGRHYRVLSGAEALICVAALWALVRWVERTTIGARWR